MQDRKSVRIEEDRLLRFGVGALTALDTPHEIATRAIRSLLDASLMGIDTHGIEALDMYINHILHGGLKVANEPIVVNRHSSFALWDMRNGIGLSSGRLLMQYAMQQAKKSGVFLLTCRNTNHIGACGIYGKIAADTGYIGICSQQTIAAFPPWGGKEARIGASPIAFVAPVAGMAPFYYDASMATMTRSQIHSSMRAGISLPEGVALDKHGRPTVDAKEAWEGQILPIGRYKGVGLAMCFEILASVLSENIRSTEIPSIVDNPDQTAHSSLFMMAIDPGAVLEDRKFETLMRKYVEFIESAKPIDSHNLPRYPGRREGEIWQERSKGGIPISEEGIAQFDSIAERLHISPIS